MGAIALLPLAIACAPGPQGLGDPCESYYGEACDDYWEAHPPPMRRTPTPRPTATPSPRVSAAPPLAPTGSPTHSPTPVPSRTPTPVPSRTPLPLPTPSPIQGGQATDPAGPTWQAVEISRLYTASVVRVGAGIQIVAEAPVNYCCYPGNTVRFHANGPQEIAVEMGGWVPHGRVCASCLAPGMITGAAVFTPDRPGRWIFRDERTGAELALDVP